MHMEAFTEKKWAPGEAVRLQDFCNSWKETRHTYRETNGREELVWQGLFVQTHLGGGACLQWWESLSSSWNKEGTFLPRNLCALLVRQLQSGAADSSLHLLFLNLSWLLQRFVCVVQASCPLKPGLLSIEKSREAAVSLAVAATVALGFGVPREGGGRYREGRQTPFLPPLCPLEFRYWDNTVNGFIPNLICCLCEVGRFNDWTYSLS